MRMLVDEVHPGPDSVHPRAMSFDNKGNMFPSNGMKARHFGGDVANPTKVGDVWVIPSNADAQGYEYRGELPRYDPETGKCRGVRQFFWSKATDLATRDYDFFQ